VHPLRPILAILLLPGTVTLLVPGLILSTRASGLTTGFSGDAPRIAAALLGLGLLAAGVLLVVTTVRHFARIGRGTLAPWDPPRHLVVIGVYRYLRNPMISGVVLILLGEALVFGSKGLALWALGFLLGNLINAPLVEEPGLLRRFGEDYRLYKQNVPRWIPRLQPWNPPWMR
jgi:protein-S-isoprenylcysteine O-methyltransferase Ste14